MQKLIHRIWLDDSVPDEFKEYGDKWRKLNPDWELKDWLHTDDVPPLINQKQFDNARDLCPKDWKRFQSDLLRLELLYMFGGVYVDMDTEPLKSFGDLLSDVTCFLCYSPNRYRGRSIFTQAVLGSESNHYFMGHLISELPCASLTYKDRPLAQMIGPHHVTRIYNKYYKRDKSITLFPSWYFGPQSIKDRDKGKDVDLSESYAWHKWVNTRDNRKGGLL